MIIKKQEEADSIRPKRLCKISIMISRSNNKINNNNLRSQNTVNNSNVPMAMEWQVRSISGGLGITGRMKRKIGMMKVNRV